MADNYLEKKMEEHRQQPRRSTSVTCAGRKPGFALLPFDVKLAFINSAEAGELLHAIATELRGTGCRVAISCPDAHATALAQSVGASYVPGDADKALEAVRAKWGDPELYIKIAEDVTVNIDRGESHIVRSDMSSAADFAQRAARLCVYLALPDSIGRVYGNFTI